MLKSVFTKIKRSPNRLSLPDEIQFIVQIEQRQRSNKTGFPPIRENREILKTFSSQGKTGGFEPKSGEKFSNQGTFFKTICKPFNLRKMFFKECKSFFQELTGNCI